MAPSTTVLGLALLAKLATAEDATDDDSSDSIFIDPDSFPDDWYGGLQLTQLFLAYCVILYFGCNMISDGAELLMFWICARTQKLHSRHRNPSMFQFCTSQQPRTQEARYAGIMTI